MIDHNVRRAEPLRRDGWSYCYRCGESWHRATKHVTTFNDHDGCFPLCEPCWQALGPLERIPYYRMLWHEWNAWGESEHDWDAIAVAVLADG